MKILDSFMTIILQKKMPDYLLAMPMLDYSNNSTTEEDYVLRWNILSNLFLLGHKYEFKFHFLGCSITMMGDSKLLEGQFLEL